MKSVLSTHFLASTILNASFAVAVALLIAMALTAPVKAQTSPTIQSTPLNLSTIKSDQQKINTRIPADKNYILRLDVSSMNLILGKSTLLKLPAPITRISVGSPKIADVVMINPKEVYVLGKLIGMTNITLWTKDGKSKVVDIAVLMDAAALQAQLLDVMPKENGIKVTAAGDSLILSGTISNTIMVDRSIALADAFIRTSILNMMVNLGGSGKSGGGASGQQGMQLLRQGIQVKEDSLGGGAGLGSFKVINLLHVLDNQQVMLEVVIAEVNRTEAERLGFEFTNTLGQATSAWTQLLTGVIGGGVASFLTGSGSSSEWDHFGEGNLLIDAEKRDEIVKILAEPTIVAISGQEASFLVGGEILIPIASGIQGVRLQAKEFGVSLRFTPTVLEEGRINLNVNPEVSELVGFEEVATSGLGSIVAVPTFRTRRISTTVQLRDGQSLVIGGLLQDNFKEQIERFPILGEIPILGALFTSSSYEMNKTELMIIVTPRLVTPLQPDYILPTDAFVRPDRAEFFLQGRLESMIDDSETTDTGDLTSEKEPNYPADEVESGGFQMQ